MPDWAVRRANKWVLGKKSGTLRFEFSDGGVRMIKKGENEYPPDRKKKK